MIDETPRELIDALDDLLEQERAALLKGELDRLGQLLSQKEALIGRINASHVSEQAGLAGLHDKLTRNQALLSSAMEGIRAVANRMADLRDVRRGLKTYDRSGRKIRFGTLADNNVEKRA